LSAPVWSKPIVDKGRPPSKLELSITALEADTSLAVFDDHGSDPLPVSEGQEIGYLVWLLRHVDFDVLNLVAAIFHFCGGGKSAIWVGVDDNVGLISLSHFDLLIENEVSVSFIVKATPILFNADGWSPMGTEHDTL